MQQLKKLRLEKGVSQKAVAQYLNVSQQTVSRYETSDNLSVSQDILIQLAHYYNVSIDYILSGKTDAKKSIINEKEGNYLKTDPIEKELQNVYQRLNDYNKETLILLGRRLLEEQEKRRPI